MGGRRGGGGWMEGWGWVDGGVGVGGWMGVGMSRCAPPLLRLHCCASAICASVTRGNPRFSEGIPSYDVIAKGEISAQPIRLQYSGHVIGARRKKPKMASKLTLTSKL